LLSADVSDQLSNEICNCGVWSRNSAECSCIQLVVIGQKCVHLVSVVVFCVTFWAPSDRGWRNWVSWCRILV
jgi:hypothetical protein